MFELIDVGGSAILPIVFCSIISFVIVIDGSWMSRGENILQRKLLKEPSTKYNHKNRTIHFSAFFF